MKLSFLAVPCMAALLAAAPSLLADPIPYPNPGTPTPLPPPFVPIIAANTTITAYFWGSDAADTDQVELFDITQGITSNAILVNHGTTPGASANFTFAVLGQSVHVGDSLAFLLTDGTTSATWSTTPTMNSDGMNHAYITPFSGPGDPSPGNPGDIPAGLFVGFEDRPIPNPAPGEPDYNDDEFVFTNVAMAPTPEPSSIALLGTGLLAAAGAVRRRLLS